MPTCRSLSASGASPDERYEIGELERAGATAIAVSLAEAVRMIRSRVAIGRKPEPAARVAPAFQAIVDPTQCSNSHRLWYVNRGKVNSVQQIWPAC